MIDEPDLRTVIREVGGLIMPTALAAVDDRCTPGRWTFDDGRDGGRGKPYRSVTDIERWVLLIFLALHLVLLVVLTWISLSDPPTSTNAQLPVLAGT